MLLLLFGATSQTGVAGGIFRSSVFGGAIIGSRIVRGMGAI